jgi:hypothetical protein
MAEIFGAIGLLLPWSLVPALIGLTVDMFGAVLTHIHNGDALNGSTGAIGLLIRLIAVGVLWTLRPATERASKYASQLQPLRPSQNDKWRRHHSLRT